jgi:protein-S-isoprenylcysteine O-methyltransferase Ste14
MNIWQDMKFCTRHEQIFAILAVSDLIFIVTRRMSPEKRARGQDMLLRDHLASTGASLFRWRSFVLLAFVPFIIWATMQGEQVEHLIGDFWGEVFEITALMFVVVGELIRILTVGFVPAGTSGRNTGAGQVASRLNTSGAYAMVRNPLYLGNCLMYVGIALYAQSVVLALVMALVLLPYYERIIAAEENFLLGKFGEDYATWAARTPAFIPRLSQWQRPDMPFSWRSVVRREHASVFGAIVAIYLVTWAQHWADGQVLGAWFHLTMGGIAVVELVIVALKKRTRLLVAAGR